MPTIGPLLPPMIFVIDIPTRPEDIAKRHHNKIVRTAMQRTVEKHYRTQFPDHFKTTNRLRYNHAPRTEKYKRYKSRRFGSRADLVLTGRSKDWMTRAHKIRIGGNAEAGTTNATIIVNFPFKGGTGRFKDPTHFKAAAAQKSIKNMIRELETFADDEKPKIAQWFLEFYMQECEKFRGGRKRKRIPIT